MQNTNMDMALEWDSEISKDSEFVLLPEGDYEFEVTQFERARHGGSEKLPACPKAVVHLRIDSSNDTAIIKHNLFLHRKTEGLLCAFFTAIGHRQHGEPLKMDWNRVVGSKGRCKVSVRTFTKDNGEDGKSNEITKFYDYEKPAFKAGEF